MHFAAAGGIETVSVRRIGRSECNGCRTISLTQSDADWSFYALIVNTIPAKILTAECLQRLSPDTLVLDLASKPGGADVEDRGW